MAIAAVMGHWGNLGTSHRMRLPCVPADTATARRNYADGLVHGLRGAVRAPMRTCLPLARIGGQLREHGRFIGVRGIEQQRGLPARPLCWGQLSTNLCSDPHRAKGAGSTAGTNGGACVQTPTSRKAG